MRYFLLIFCFFLVSCGQKEPSKQSSPADRSSALSNKGQKDTEKTSESQRSQKTVSPSSGSQESEEPSTVMEVDTIVLIPRIRITCRGWLLPNYKDLTCDRGTPVCGRRASADPSSEPRPYCVIGDPEQLGAQLTMIPPEVASPYCKDIPFKAGDGGEIECFTYHGD